MKIKQKSLSAFYPVLNRRYHYVTMRRVPFLASASSQALPATHYART